MKKFILLVLIFAGCKKDEPNLTSIKVAESVTETPIAGANLSLYRCNYGCPFGPKVLFEGVTDNDGACQVPAESYSDVESEMYAMKAKYWDFEVQKNTLLHLTPEGWLKLRIQKVGNYPAGSKLNLNLYNQSGSRSDLTFYNIALDSVIMVRAFGSQINKINWQVVGATLLNYGTLTGLQIPRFDTLKNVTLNY